MDVRERRLLREIIKQVHPDVLANRPLEQAHNTEALKVTAHLQLCASRHIWQTSNALLMVCRHLTHTSIVWRMKALNVTSVSASSP